LLGSTCLTLCYKLFLYPEYRISGIRVSGKSEALFVSFFFGYWVLAFLAFNISGAHYNPAVTLAFLFKRESNFNRVLCLFYFAAQFAGGFLGAFLGFLLTRAGGDLYVKGGSKFLF